MNFISEKIIGYEIKSIILERKIALIIFSTGMKLNNLKKQLEIGNFSPYRRYLHWKKNNKQINILSAPLREFIKFRKKLRSLFGNYYETLICVFPNNPHIINLHAPASTITRIKSMNKWRPQQATKRETQIFRRNNLDRIILYIYYF